MAEEVQFIRLSSDDGTWDEFEKDWRKQCEEVGEDFDSYAENTFAAVRDLILKQQAKAGVYALKHDGVFVAMCQLNKSPLPKFDSPVLRVRFMTLSPDFDFNTKSAVEYGGLLVSLLMEVLTVAYLDNELSCMHVKFHLRSQSDQTFFATFGAMLREQDIFKDVDVHGAWLHISRK